MHKDFAVRFDGNTYTTPPWTVGKKLTVKADMATVTIYHGPKKIVSHHRFWQRHCRIENKAHKEQVKKINKRLWQDRQIAALASLGTDARQYLQRLIDNKVVIDKNVSKILDLKNEYGSDDVDGIFVDVHTDKCAMICHDLPPWFWLCVGGMLNTAQHNPCLQEWQVFLKAHARATSENQHGREWVPR